MDCKLLLGEKLDIVIGDRKCVSSVREVLPEGLLRVTMPLYRGESVPLERGTLVQMMYYRPQGMFSFVAEVMRILTLGWEPLLEMDYKSPVTKVQRREFTRLETGLAVRILKLAGSESLGCNTVEDTLRRSYDMVRFLPGGYGEPGRIAKGRTLDISGGGLRFVSAENYPVDTLLRINLRLEEGEPVAADCAVVRTDKGNGGAVNAARFVCIDERDRRKIIRFVLARDKRRRLVF